MMNREELNDALCEMGAEGSTMLDGYDEAIEWISYNTIRSLDYVPEEGRPVIINLMN